MKKIIAILAIVCSMVEAIEAANPKIVATTSFLRDITQNIAGPQYKVISIMPVGGDPHIYDPVPQDAKLIADADLIIKNGLLLEGWLDKLIANSGTNANILIATQGIAPITSIDYHNAPDPHAWMSVSNAMIYAANIRDALVQLLPEDAQTFQSNYKDYLAQLSELDSYVRAEIQKIPESKRILVTSHDAFRYFGNEYGIKVESALGTSTDADVQIKDMNNLIQVIKNHNLPAIFVESTINPKLLQQLASDLKIKIGGKLFADSLGDEDSGADTYLKMVRQNTITIVEGLTAQGATDPAESSFKLFLIVVLGLFVIAFVVIALRIKKTGPDLPDEGFNVQIEGLDVSYGRKSVLSNIYLHLVPGKLYGLVGPNGAGKSTLFKAMLGLIDIEDGTVQFNGLQLDKVHKYIAYIPQKEEIDWNFPATVIDIVLMGRYPHKKVFEKLSQKDYALAKEAMAKVDITDLRNKQIGELSGGQQQRVFLARALCQDAHFYLFDEPFVGVDITTEDKIMKILKDLAAKGSTILVIHHDLSKVEEYFEQLIMLNQRIIGFGPTANVFTSENIKKTYSSRTTLLEETEEFIYQS